MALLTFALITIVFFGVLMPLLFVYLRRVVDGAFTSHFRAAEAIDNGHVPPDWVKQINRQLRWRKLLPLGRAERAGTLLALQKIEKLSRFFKDGQYFADEAARELLLSRLAAAHKRWAQMSWDEIQRE